MIRLGLRLTLNGGKEAAVRLAITTVAVAFGVGLLLVALAGLNAVNAQNARTAWLNTTPIPGGQTVMAGGLSLTANGSAPSPSTAPLWWRLSTDHFGTQTIDRVDVAATGPSSPVPPGLRRLPGPGQFYASPALRQLLRSTPADQLGDRFPGHDIGTIGAAGLPSPDSLIAVVGHSPAELSRVPGAIEVSNLNTDPTLGGAAGGFHVSEIRTLLAIGVLALLLPVLIFIATAARLAAARREQRFAAMRLVGATPHQVDVIATVESVVAALFGVVLGILVFLAVRPALTNVPFTGQPFAPGDLTLSVTNVVIVVIGVPVAAAASALVAMQRVRISPLGVRRRATPRPLRAYRIAPLAAGVGLLVAIDVVGRPSDVNGQILAYGSAALLLIVGLVLAGPWLVSAGSRLLVRRAGRPASLLAGRRMSDNPRAAFRAISGLIVALFAASASVAVVTTVLDDGGKTGRDPAATATLLADPGTVTTDHFTNVPGQQTIGPQFHAVEVPPSLLRALESIPGVRGVTYLYADPDGQQDGSIDLASCRELARTPVLGSCRPGSRVAQLSSMTLGVPDANQPNFEGHAWPGADVQVGQLDGLPVRGIVVQTDGSTSAVERARTTLEEAFPNQAQPPDTLSHLDAQGRRLIKEVQELTSLIIVVSLIIGGCSLAVSVVAGISDRKRPFSLLRLAGTPLRVLRQMVLWESAAPLLAISVLSVGLGFLAAGLFLDSQLSEPLRAPGLSFFALVLAGLLVALAAIGLTLPLVERIAGPEVARDE